MGQWEAVRAIEAATTPVVIVEGPTGVGKTTLVLSVLRRALGKSFILTPNISLQDQYLYEANGNAVKVVGRRNYNCPLYSLDEGAALERGVGRGGVTVDEAPCGAGFKCPYKEHCGYYVDKGEALRSAISVHNYAYWLPESSYVGGFIGADWIVADEGHLLDGTNGILSAFGQVVLTGYRLNWLARKGVQKRFSGLTVEEWKEVGGRAVVEASLDIARETIGTVARAKALSVAKLWASLAGLEVGDERWIVDEGSGGVKLRPVWPPDAQRVLLEGKGKRLMIVSATIGDPRTFAKYLGIDNYTFIKLPWVFPPEIRPVFYRPVGAVTWENKAAVAPNLARAITEILGRRKGEKGIIHTQSFALSEAVEGFLDEDTKSRIIFHRQGGEGMGTRAEAIEAFKSSKEDTWLMSPSVGHGEDFTEATGQIILKMPFPDLSDRVVKIRTRHDPHWYKWETARELQQRIGRVTRREDGYGETWILDSKFSSVVDYLPEEIKSAIN